MQLLALKSKAGGATEENRACWFEAKIIGYSQGGFAFLLVRLPQVFLGQLQVTTQSRQLSQICQLHSFTMEELNVLHRLATLDRGVPNSTTTIKAGRLPSDF